jgi:acetate kinase
VRVLVVNAGSSSLKLRLLDGDDELDGARDLALNHGNIDDEELHGALAGMDRADAIGHRIVHGGRRYRAPVRIDDRVVVALRELTDLAPLHQPKSLAALDAVARALPEVPAVACFDTAFHATLPAAAATFALPSAWRQRWDLRRYGFHGLSHAYASRRATELTGAARVLTCHLGAGASLAAVRHGRSIDTTMGFTPLDGLVMATRPGSIDPGLLLWLLDHGEMSEPEMAKALEHDAGLAGLAGTDDMREILARAELGDDEARLALDVYLHRLRAGIAAMAAALSGVEVIAFTGGVGERAPAVRAGALAGLEFLGVRIDRAQNESAHGDTEITGPGSATRVLVVAAREDLEIARQVRHVMEPRSGRKRSPRDNDQPGTHGV